jgi:hypothetical protein
LQKHFGQSGAQKVGCGFPTAHLLMMFDATTGMIGALIFSKRKTHDLTNVAKIHPTLKRGDLLLGDRAFGAYAHLGSLVLAGIEGVFRLNQKVIVSFKPGREHNQRSQANRIKGRPSSRWIEALGDEDQLVEYHRPRQRSAILSRAAFDALPDTLVVRELRYRIKRNGFRVRRIVLVTTLLDPDRYTKQDLIDLYHRRWQIETWIGHLKTSLNMDVVKCKTVDGVIKELTMFALVYNLVRVAMLHAAKAKQFSAERISFTDALRWLRCNAVPNRLCRLQVNPLRLNRVEPRAVKRRPKPFKLMTKPRNQLRQHLINQRVAA